MNISPYRPSDLSGLYHVCLATGDSGEDATGLYLDPNLLGHLYVGPYAALEPDFAFVLRDGDEVVGYVLGVLDTAAFETRCETHWWPPLRRMYPETAERPPREQSLVRKLHRSERTPAALLEPFPSHLHIDLLPVAQGSGWGRRMIETLLAALARAGSGGVHLGVGGSNRRAIGFYRHLGFQDLSGNEKGLLMGRSLP